MSKLNQTAQYELINQSNSGNELINQSDSGNELINGKVCPDPPEC